MDLVVVRAWLEIAYYVLGFVALSVLIVAVIVLLYHIIKNS